MEENKDIDSLFKSSLEKFEMPPSADIWTSMDIELTKKLEAKSKEKNKRFLLLLFLLLLFCVPLIGYYFKADSDKQLAQNIINDKKETTLLKNTESVPGKTNKDLIKTNVAESIKTEPNRNKPGSVTENAKQANKIDKSNNTNVIKARDSKKLIKNDYNGYSVSRKKTNNSKSAKLKQAKITTPIVFNRLKDSKYNNQNNYADTNDKKKTNLANSSVTVKENNLKEETQINSVNKLNADSIIKTESLTTIAKTESHLSIDSSSLIVNNELKKDTSTLLNKAQIKEIEDKNADIAESINIKDLGFKRGIYIDYSLSPLYTINYLQNNDAYKSADNAIDYQSREQSKFSFSTGIALRLDLSRKWGVSLGLNYSTIAYSMALSTVYAYKNSFAEVHFQYPTSWGTIEIPNQPNFAPKVGDSLTINSTCNQLLKLINIPLIFRYSITSSRFSIYANIGASANFTIKDQAVIKTGTFEFSYTNSLVGKRNLNCSLLLGFGLQYKATNRLSIFMEPNYRASITSVTQDIPVNCYPQSIGINTGISFQLR